MATAQIPWNDGSGHNISVEWDGTQDGEIKISSPTNPSLTAQRTKSIQVRTTAGSPQLTRTINVVQEAAVYTYEYSVTASSSATLAASGGSVIYTAQLKTYLQGKLLRTETVTPTCRIISGSGFTASGNKVTAASRGTEYSVSARSAQVAVEFEAPETGEILSETVTVTQAENNRVTVYGKPNITDVTAADIPAKGGSVSSATVSYSQSRHYYYDSGVTEELSALTTGGTINYGEAVTAASLGTTIKNRAIVGTLTFTVSMNGQTSVEQDISVYQAKNVPVDAAIYEHNYTYPTGVIPASGGTKTPSSYSTVKLTWSSGSTSIVSYLGATGITAEYSDLTYSMIAATGFSINSSTGVVTAANRGTTEGSERKSGNCSRHIKWTITVSDTYGGGSFVVEDTKTLTTPVTQQANSATYGDVSLTVTSPVSVDVDGGQYNITASGSQTVSFTSGASRAGSVSLSYAQASAVDGFSLNGSTVTASENTTTSTKSYTVNVTATGEGSKKTTKQVVFNQADGQRTYSEITVSLSYPQASAAGGTVSPVLTYSQTWGWNGSTTGGGTITSGAQVSYSGTNINASTGVATVASKGTTESGVTTATTATVTVSMNGKTAKKSAAVQQAANVATITYENPVVHLVVDDDIPARGGSVSSGTVTYSQSRAQKYTSGATSPLSDLTTGGQISYGAAVSGSDLGAIETDRSYIGALTVTVTMNGKSGSDSADVYQEANVCIDTYIDYGKWVVSVSANRYTTSSSPCPASGGTCTITASASRMRTQKYQFTSGSLTSKRLPDETTTPTLSIRGTGASLNGTTVTWASRGTTTGEVRQATITAEVEFASAKEIGLDSAEEIVYQQENAITETTYSIPTVTISSVADIPASGGSVSTGTASYSQTRTDTYTSGSSKPTTLTSGGTVEWSTVSAGTKGTTVSARTEVDEITCTVTLNSKSGSATKMVYQAANSKNEVSRVITVSVPSGDIPAEGGTKTVTRSGVINYSFTSGATTTSSFTPTLSISGTGFSLNGTTVTAANRSTTVGERRSATVTASYEGATSKTATVYQQENEVVSITYGTPQVVLNVSDIPASGGTVSSGIVNYLQSRTRNYTSGATSRMSSLSSGGVITYSDAVSGANLGTTEKERTKLGTLTATVTMNGKSDSDSADVYQEANVRTAGDISYGDWQVSVYAREYISSSSPCPASGDSFTIYSSASRTRVQEYNYTSGATDTETLSTETATPELSVSGEGGLSLSGNTATYANRGTTEGNLRSNTILATYEGAYDTEQVYQEENVKTAGSISYGTWQVSVSANRYTSSSSPCPAGGGTCTITASATRTRNQSYSYTSGATSTEALTNESGTPTLSISGTGASLSGATVTWVTRGTEYSTTTRSATVKATMDTVTAEEVVYQAKNEYTEEWDNPVVDMQPSSHTISSIGNDWYVDSFSATQSGTRTYDSGSTQSVTNSEFTWSSSENVDWLSSQVEFNEDFCITSDDNEGSSSRSGVVTLTATGKGDKTGSDTITITQEGVSVSNYLNVSPTSLSFEAAGGTKTITIDTNESWTIE